MAKIVITRKSEWTNRLKRFSVLINGKELGTVKSGATEEYEVTAGEKTVECKVNWYYSNKFVVNATEGKTVFLEVKNNTKILLIAIFIIMALFLVSTILQSKGYIGTKAMDGIRIGYFVLLLGYFVYLLTIGRKRYLSLGFDTTNPFAN